MDAFHSHTSSGIKDMDGHWLLTENCHRQYAGQITWNHRRHSKGNIFIGLVSSGLASDLFDYINTPQGTVIHVQYIPTNMHTVFALLCFVVVIDWLIIPYPSGLLHWHCGNQTIAPVPAKHPWWIWINTSYEFIMNDCITTRKQSTTKPCAYFLGYTVASISLVQRTWNWTLLITWVLENKILYVDESCVSKWLTISFVISIICHPLPLPVQSHTSRCNHLHSTLSCLGNAVTDYRSFSWLHHSQFTFTDIMITDSTLHTKRVTGDCSGNEPW